MQRYLQQQIDKEGAYEWNGDGGLLPRNRGLARGMLLVLLKET